MSAGSGRPPVRVTVPTVTLAHGGGGQAMRDLIADVFAGPFANPMLLPLEDQARAGLAELVRHGDRLAITTDSFVVDPLFFPGGDIGRLAVCGTVNDLAVGGGRPLYLCCAVIIEEGLPVETLRRISASMRAAADLAGIAIVTGDTKVVPRGAADRLFITTTGIGVIPHGISIAASQLELGDRIVVNDFLGDHGIAILAARGDLDFETDLRSDCRPLHGLVRTMLEACPEIRAMRDITRGGLAAVLNEFAAASACGIEIDEGVTREAPGLKQRGVLPESGIPIGRRRSSPTLLRLVSLLALQFDQGDQSIDFTGGHRSAEIIALHLLAALLIQE
ncbi:MAG TPA: hydrogenase expression/formation protein HypE, partial [Geminicoccaceae bacterium]|nr:hydrogenase expression/formation protein HypE [Geminicoccaceae bacterium]